MLRREFNTAQTLMILLDIIIVVLGVIVEAWCLVQRNLNLNYSSETVATKHYTAKEAIYQRYLNIFIPFDLYKTISVGPKIIQNHTKI